MRWRCAIRCRRERGGVTCELPPASLGRGFRLQWEAAQNAYVLLFPEGMIKLNASAGEIMKRCDGQRDDRRDHRGSRAGVRDLGLSADVIAFVVMARDKQWLSVPA